MSSPDWWVTIVAAGVPAVAAVNAAIIASRASKAVRRTEIKAQQVRDLEERVHSKKHEIYEPMLTTFQKLLTEPPPVGAEAEEALKRIRDFSTWVLIYGSDEAIAAFRRFKQGPGNPGSDMWQLYADFILAARRDLGYPETGVSHEHVVGLYEADA